MTQERHLNVGKIIGTHGVRGEVRVWPQTDFPDIRFAKGSKLLLLQPGAVEPVQVEVQSARQQKKVYILKIKGIDNRDEAETYRGAELKVTGDHRVPLSEGEYYIRDIVGCSVWTDDGEQLGVVSDVLTPGANDVWVVSRPQGKDLLLPVIDDVVLEVDVPGKRIRVQLLEGLL